VYQSGSTPGDKSIPGWHAWLITYTDCSKFGFSAKDAAESSQTKSKV